MCYLRFGTDFIYYVSYGTSVILDVPHAGLRQHKLFAKNIEKSSNFRQKTLKNKEKPPKTTKNHQINHILAPLDDYVYLIGVHPKSLLINTVLL